MVGDKTREWYDRRAKERQAEGGKKHGKGVVSLPHLEPAKARDEAGRAVGVSGQTVAAVLGKAREAGAAPRSGEVGRNRRANGTPNARRGSNQQSYLARRLLRDAPDTFAALERGDFKSVRAAAIEAGIVKAVVQIPIDPVRAAGLLRKHFPKQLPR